MDTKYPLRYDALRGGAHGKIQKKWVYKAILKKTFGPESCQDKDPDDNNTKVRSLYRFRNMCPEWDSTFMSMRP